jgi:hypothetical protein
VGPSEDVAEEDAVGVTTLDPNRLRLDFAARPCRLDLRGLAMADQPC